jgi:Ca2+-binding RTX toxin-like protein
MSTFVGSTTGVPDTGLVYVDGLLWGGRWQIENDNRRLTYSFVDNQTWDDPLFSAEETAFHNAMNAWANVANFRLEFSGYNDSNAEITFHSVQADRIGGVGALGLARPPGEPPLPPPFSLFAEGDVMINWEAYQDNPDAALIPGGFYYYTFVHEIGHALGLAHPHDNGGASSIFPGVDPNNPFTSTGNFGLNQYVWTIMSYVTNNSSYSPGYDTNWGYIGGPMAFDIAAIQHIYGANTTYNTGNNIYYLPTTNGAGTYWSCIWDAGGTDTISGQGATNSVTINLNGASLANNDPNAGGYINRVSGIKGGFTIANSQGGKCVIENALGGDYNDTLIGNSSKNNLFGDDGNDSLSGEGGNDTLDGGSGADILYGGFGTDSLVGGNGNDSLDSGTTTDYDSANETLDGGAGNDYLIAGFGSDRLIGGSGSDTLVGFRGNDAYVVDSTGDTIIENANEGTDTINSSVACTLVANLENLLLTGTSNINGTGNSLNNSITGNGANNTLRGNSSNDTLIGGGGNDTLVGGAGNDTLTGGAGKDRFTFNLPNERIDRITDFLPVDDTIAISASGFGGGLVAGAAITAAQFRIGASATTANHRFMYNSTNGGLFFDKDGIGAIAQLQIATLNAGLTMTNNDIFVLT